VKVTPSESDELVGAMQRNGQAVIYLLYPDEGHGFVRPENNLSFVAVMEAFLATHLGGQHRISTPISTAALFRCSWAQTMSRD
jgi:dipeptidyl aminopeptidase/acylaminoacyl peptidase